MHPVPDVPMVKVVRNGDDHHRGRTVACRRMNQLMRQRVTEMDGIALDKASSH